MTMPRAALFEPAAADAPVQYPGATLYDAPVAETFMPADETPYVSRRADGWSAANQRVFLEALAEGFGVEAACYRVGLSAASAYAFRRTAKGAAFALGWRAATLVARDAIAETLLVRALQGQVDTYTRADGSVVTRHRHDNRLAATLLARLDRQVETAPDADVKAARLVAQEFDAFLDLVGADGGPARAGLFLARRSEGLVEGAEPAAHDLSPLYALAAADRLVRTGVATAGEVDVSDLDPACRRQWTGEQWARAEAAGLVALAAPAAPEPDPQTAPQDPRAPQHSQHSPDPDAEAEPEQPPHVWWCEHEEAWRTDFPPPDDFFGAEEGVYGDDGYERELTEDEIEVWEAPLRHRREMRRRAGLSERAAFFAEARGEGAGQGASAEPTPLGSC